MQYGNIMPHKLKIAAEQKTQFWWFLQKTFIWPKNVICKSPSNTATGVNYHGHLGLHTRPVAGIYQLNCLAIPPDNSPWVFQGFLLKVHVVIPLTYPVQIRTGISPAIAPGFPLRIVHGFWSSILHRVPPGIQPGILSGVSLELFYGFLPALLQVLRPEFLKQFQRFNDSYKFFAQEFSRICFWKSVGDFFRDSFIDLRVFQDIPSGIFSGTSSLVPLGIPLAIYFLVSLDIHPRFASLTSSRISSLILKFLLGYEKNPWVSV